MSLIEESANKFVTAMNESKRALEQVQTSVSNRKTEVEKTINELKANIDKSVGSVSVNEDSSQEIKDVLKASVKILGEVINNCNTEIIQANKGIKFIEDFEKTFIVSIFGKVKAGKSYLGNFIMGSSFKKHGVKTEFDKLGDIEVTVYDRGKQTRQSALNVLEEDTEGFKVGSTETTSTIQWFDIGGLSWFDTPGIGSVTLDNENLAKEYVKNSDLVIFVSNSDAAGTRQEFEEMQELANMNKPILLMVTMSDTYEEDVDDDGNLIQILQPKSDKDRQDVENYLLETLRENGLQKILDLSEILTISAKLADEAVKKGDDKLYAQSNLDKLFDRLVDITCNEAAQMKLNTPKDRINKMINNIIGGSSGGNSLTTLKNSINEICSDFINTKERSKMLKTSISEEIRNTCRVKIMDMIYELKKELDNGRRSISSEEIAEKVENILITTVEGVCSRELSKIIGKFNADTQRLKNVNINVGSMKIKTDSVAYEEKIVERYKRRPKGFFEHVGAFLGKTYYDTETRTVTRYSEFDIGDNSTQITSDILQSLNNIINEEVDLFIQDIIIGYYKPIENIKNIAVSEIDTAMAKLEELKL